MLRITHSGHMTFAIVELDGKLVGPWTAELAQSITSMRAAYAVCLNLTHLTFADAAGLRLLRTLRSQGVPLLGVMPLIEGLLASCGRYEADVCEAGRETLQSMTVSRAPNIYPVDVIKSDANGSNRS